MIFKSSHNSGSWNSVRWHYPRQLAGLLLGGCLISGVTPAAEPVFFPFVQNPFGLVDVSGYESRPELVDIDGDGDLDVITAAAYSNIFFFQNTGNSTSPGFAAPVSNPFGLPAITVKPTLAFGDLDGDGDLDLVYQEGALYAFYACMNTGNSTSPAFAPKTGSPFGINSAADITLPDFVDIDGDGDLDLGLGSGSGNVFFRMNTGSPASPAFSSLVTNPFGLSGAGASFSPEFTDLDGDGDFDLLATDFLGTHRFFRNTGSAIAPAFASPLTNPFGLSAISVGGHVTTGNLDGDTDPDVLCGSQNRFRYFQNASEPLDIPLGIQLAQPSTTDQDNLRFDMRFRRPVSPTFTAADVALTGTLASGSKLLFGGNGEDPSYFVIVSLANRNSNGTIGISINGAVSDTLGIPLVTPVASPAYTIIHYPPGDVNKDGTFNLADVAILADANLGLVALP